MSHICRSQLNLYQLLRLSSDHICTTYRHFFKQVFWVLGYKRHPLLFVLQHEVTLLVETTEISDSDHFVSLASAVVLTFVLVLKSEVAFTKSSTLASSEPSISTSNRSVWPLEEAVEGEFVFLPFKII